MIRELKGLENQIFTQLTFEKILADFINAFLIVVLSIPEGLPLIITLSMAFSIGRLKEEGVIVRNLHTC
jgi:Ca2+ transporting ATPase